MWPRLQLNDVRSVGHYLGILILISTFGLVLPLVTAVIAGEWDAFARYLLAVGIFLIVGSALCFSRVEPGRLTSQQGLVVTGLAWLVLAFIAAIPLSLSGHYSSYADALFEAVSGLTTTGASVVQDLDHLSYADNMWRFMMHLIGGLGFVTVGLTFGLFGKEAASMYVSEGRSEHMAPNLKQTALSITRIALVFIAVSTVVVFALSVFVGIDPVRAFLQSFWVSISAYMTAGFVPQSQNIMYYHSLAIEFVLVLVMMLGSINFMLHSEIIHGNTKEVLLDTEVKFMLAWLVLVVVVFTSSLAASASFSDLPAMMRRGLFMIVAAFTTTGFQNITTPQLTDTLTSGAFLVLAICMAVGASSGSTAGGIKVHRFAILAKSIVSTLKATLAPESARIKNSYYHSGRRIVTPQIVQEATTVLILYGVTYILGTLAGIAHGYEASQAVFESIAMASNGGITSGIVSPGMPLSLEMIYLFEMWAGRLEFITLLALIAQLFASITPKWFIEWRSRKQDW